MYEDNKIKKHEDLDELYASVNQCRTKSSVPMNEELHVQHPHLLPTLRAYQSDAVRWMIGKEQAIEKTGNLLMQIPSIYYCHLNNEEYVVNFSLTYIHSIRINHFFSITPSIVHANKNRIRHRDIF